VLSAVLWILHAWSYPASFDGGEGIRHYLFSKYSWEIPYLLLDHWGKPFFTLISSPFSQFGLNGIKFFNILCGVLTSIFLYKSAEILKIKNAFFAPFLLLFTPIYSQCVNSGLTEIFFGLVLTAGIYGYLRNEYIVSSLIISFLPFIRTEGFLLTPLFFIVLVLYRKYKMIPLLGAGLFVYSVIGIFAFDDFLWVINKNPYDGHMAHVYGSGPLMHFANAYPYLWELPLTILLVSGLFVSLINFRKLFTDKLKTTELILVYGSLIIYFVAHSIFWWKGLYNSYGLVRVIAGVVPVSIIISLRGLEKLSGIVKPKLFQNVIIAGIMLLIAWFPFYKKHLPLRLDHESKLVLEASQWYNNSEYKNKNPKIYYLHPFFTETIRMHPFDPSQTGELWYLYPDIKKWGYDFIPDGTIILWDSHFGSMEARIDRDFILSDPNFKLIKSFHPEEEQLIKEGLPLEIMIFEKIQFSDSAARLSFTKVMDFEHLNKDSLSDGISISEEEEFGLNLIQNTSDLPFRDNIVKIYLSFKFRSEDDVNAKFVLSSHKDQTQTMWRAILVTSGPTGNKWTDYSGTWLTDSEAIAGSDFLKIYYWNLSKSNVFIKDLEVRFITPGSEK
jgi:hypothetical protein